MTAYRSGRALPAHITIPNWEAFQVRIVRDGVEHSASFSWEKHGGQAMALAEAVAWRDALLAELPASGNARGATRREPLRHKQSWNRVGITRYFRDDRRKVGNPKYLTFGVNWVDTKGRRRTKSFQIGRVEDIHWKDEVHAANTAEAFRCEFEFCQAHGKPFDPSRYEGWRNKTLYPFNQNY